MDLQHETERFSHEFVDAPVGLCDQRWDRRFGMARRLGSVGPQPARH